MSLRLTEEHGAPETDCDTVVEGLRSYNAAFRQWADQEPLNLFLRDEEGQIQGGLLAVTRWHWLQIGILWLAEECRGQGYGSAILCRAEEIGRGRGCRRASLDTAEFQARAFYERHGYRVFGELEDYPPGWRTYFMEKTLAE